MNSFILDNFKKILVLAPHTDDAELGCGGTIAKLIEAGREVFWVIFSKASVPKNFSSDPDVVLGELKQSAKVMGIKPKNLIIYKYPVRHLLKYRQDILEEMVNNLKKNINPDLVLVPSLNDIHQDHFTITQEGLRAFKNTTILSYEIPWNNLTFNTTCFIYLEKRHIKKKTIAIGKYKSQSHRLFIKKKDFAENLARTRGVQIGTEYAEAFEVVRLIL